MLIEDHLAIRQMLAAALASLPEFEIVAEAGDLTEAVRLAGETNPDVVVLDWVFPGGGGAQFLDAKRADRLPGHVLVLSANTRREVVREALRSGARGFFEKAGNLAEFVCALRTVAAGGAYFGPKASMIVKRLVSEAANDLGSADQAVALHEPESVAPGFLATGRA